MGKLVALTGAGISAESGLKTFRDADGLWEGYRVEDVATPEAWQRDPELVLQFYNERRKAVIEAIPNLAHQALVDLESLYDVSIVTQNIDNLHERAGSTDVLHLHGLITKAQSSLDPGLIYEIEGAELKRGELCERGAQLRPHVVWFGEAVPAMEQAVRLTMQAEILIIVGTSMVVYPAASIIDYVRPGVPVYYVNPQPPPEHVCTKITHCPGVATKALPLLVGELCEIAGGAA